ncbi:hypothetical protein AVEN_177577-1 [Araneus ventricosus]|uniref:Uncharacterized protein n=1 Tax=Araneus ventricosus TaxID=182803 RepID=A0A4Y2MHF3_ARAVE|nr:hypothetical protein AVEN_177577-1 [Araneus ventricosus]
MHGGAVCAVANAYIYITCGWQFIVNSRRAYDDGSFFAVYCSVPGFVFLIPGGRCAYCRRVFLYGEQDAGCEQTDNETLLFQTVVWRLRADGANTAVTAAVLLFFKPAAELVVLICAICVWIWRRGRHFTAHNAS